jgi:RNA polymerase sigma-70 factor (ECF subfamily)
MLRMDDVDRRVFALLDAGDAGGAATVAIESYGPAIHAYLSRLLDADDVLDVFRQWAADVWRGLPGFRRDRRLRVWAFKLAYHAASRFLRDPCQARRQRLASSAASRLALLVLRHDRELSWDEIVEILSRD